MRYVCLTLALAGIGLSGSAVRAQAPKTPAKALPAIDSSVTSKTETATFALG